MFPRLFTLVCVCTLFTHTIGSALSAEPAVQQSPIDAEAAAPQSTLPARLGIMNDNPGTGTPITAGAFAVLHYDAYVYDPAAPGHRGAKFDSSRERGEPLSYVYGYKRAVPGLEKGLAGMRVGGSRTIIVPPKLGYDGLKYRAPDLPPNSALVFDVELIDVVPESAPPDR